MISLEDLVIGKRIQVNDSLENDASWNIYLDYYQQQMILNRAAQSIGMIWDIETIEIPSVGILCFVAHDSPADFAIYALSELKLA